MKTNLKFRKEFLVLILGIFFVSCSNHIEEMTDPVDPDPGNGKTFSFATDVRPIIDANCIQCHNGSQFPDLRSFSTISANKTSVKGAVSSRRMPLGGSLTNAEINVIVSWIDSGALNN